MSRFIVALASLVWAAAGWAEEPIFNCYRPIPGGWEIRLQQGVDERPEAQTQIGVVPPGANARLFRRPLYPPADRSMLFSEAELRELERVDFRPLVLAYHEPRFLFDFHSAGGLLGHLFVGLAGDKAKWFHQWSDLELQYIEGRLEYTLTDPDFPGVTVHLGATALAHSAGLILRIEVQGARAGTRLIWGYGGASAFFTNWAMTAPEFAYAPAQCAKDHLSCPPGEFVLTRAFDKTDTIMNEVFAVPRYLPGWTAHLRGGCSWPARFGLADPEDFATSPAALVSHAEWQPQGGRTRRVAVAEAPLDQAASGYVVVGMGGDIADAIRAPARAWDEALTRNRALAGRVVTHTPDPYLDSAATMMAFATEGLWGDLVLLHGGWSWRFGYLGWRHWYGPAAYGWTDRVRQCIRLHVERNRITSGPDAGALGSLIDYSPGVFYNMNEVFLDEVRQYFDYTNDLELMREIFPVLEGILAWEDRRLRPDAEPLYENALNTWISDQHWYIRGQCTQASAYMLNANRFLADLARRLGHDPAPFQRRTEAIRRALQASLWQPRPGVFAEYRDTLGVGLLHPEPELPTLYHSAEFGAAGPFQIWQMLHWADTHLGIVRTPGGGQQFWSSDWFPNMARSYTHSSYEMAYGEELNFALTHYEVGRADDAYALLRASLCGIFNGPTPGGLSCHSYTDGRQRANDEFADAISMWDRAVTEGLFGIRPKRSEGRVEVTPQFPSTWPEASIAAPHFAYRWRRDGRRVQVTWSSPVDTSVRLRLPLRAQRIESVWAEGQPVKYAVEPGFGLTWVQIDSPAAREGDFEVVYQADTTTAPAEIRVRHGQVFQAGLEGSKVSQWRDPQGVLRQPRLTQGRLEATATGEPGPAVIFVSDNQATAPRWRPVALEIEPERPQPPPQHWEHLTSTEHDLARWHLVDLDQVFNTLLTEAMERVHAAVQPPPLPASPINTIYYKDHLVPPFVSPKPSDARWRQKIGPDGVAWTTESIPFKSAKEGPNIGVVTRAAAVFPIALEFPVNAAGRTLYLMLSGTTFAMQSHVVNLRVRLAYADGTQEAHELVNPFTIGDCWNQYRYHDTPANGFENLGGRSGPEGSAGLADLDHPIAVDTEAHLAAFPLKPGTLLRSVRLEAVANDVIFGVMGASVLK